MEQKPVTRRDFIQTAAAAGAAALTAGNVFNVLGKSEASRRQNADLRLFGVRPC